MYRLVTEGGSNGVPAAAAAAAVRCLISGLEPPQAP